MEKLKPYVAAILASFLCFGALSGCGARALPPDYRETPFRGEIIWKRGALMLQGILCFAEDGSVELTVSEPVEWRGLLLRCEGEERNIRCGDLTIDGGTAEELFGFFSLILPTGARRHVCETKLRGERVLYVELLEDQAIALYLDPTSGAPREIQRGEESVEFVSFEKTEEEREA